MTSTFPIPPRAAPVRVHVVNRLFGCERHETAPGPVELVLLNIKPCMTDFGGLWGIRLQPQEDATILFVVEAAPGVPIGLARAALEDELAHQHGRASR